MFCEGCLSGGKWKAVELEKNVGGVESGVGKALVGELRESAGPNDVSVFALASQKLNATHVMCPLICYRDLVCWRSQRDHSCIH